MSGLRASVLISCCRCSATKFSSRLAVDVCVCGSDRDEEFRCWPSDGAEVSGSGVLKTEGEPTVEREASSRLACSWVCGSP